MDAHLLHFHADDFRSGLLDGPATSPVEKKTMHWADWLVFALFLAFSLGIGIYTGLCGRKQSAKEFLNSNRDMSILPVALSIMSSFLSAILILGMPAEIYLYGTLYWMTVIGIALAVLLATLLFVPLLYPLGLTSSYEYLELRFKSPWPKLVGTLILFANQVLYMGICLFSPATALEAVTGFPEFATILVGGGIAIIYTALGGLKASVLTSAVQTVVMAGGMLIVIIKGIADTGMGTIWEENKKRNGTELFDFDFNPLTRHTFWNLVFGAMMSWLSTYGTNQSSVQRFSSLPTIKKAKITMLINIPGQVLFVSMACFSGFILYGFYASRGCDPLSDGQILNENQLMPYFVLQEVNVPTVPGLFMACLFSGSLSSVSSCLSSLASVTWKDILSGCLGDTVSESSQRMINKALVLFYGCLGIAMAFLAQSLGGTVLQASLSFTGAAGGPLLGLFLLGGLFPWANKIGAVVGGLLGLAFPLWIAFGSYTLDVEIPRLSQRTDWCFVPNDTSTSFSTMVAPTGPSHIDGLEGLEKLYSVSYQWYSLIGAGVTVLVGLVVSGLTGFTKLEDVNPKYIIPLFDRLCCCICPNSALETLRCHIDVDNAYNDDLKLDENKEPMHQKDPSIAYAVPEGSMYPHAQEKPENIYPNNHPDSRMNFGFLISDEDCDSRL